MSHFSPLSIVKANAWQKYHYVLILSYHLILCHDLVWAFWLPFLPCSGDGCNWELHPNQLGLQSLILNCLSFNHVPWFPKVKKQHGCFSLEKIFLQAHLIQSKRNSFTNNWIAYHQLLDSMIQENQCQNYFNPNKPSFNNKCLNFLSFNWKHGF